MRHLQVKNPMWGWPIRHPLPLPDVERPEEKAVARFAYQSRAENLGVGWTDEVDVIAGGTTWDAPLTLLSDDEPLARQLQELGVDAQPPALPYAERQHQGDRGLQQALDEWAEDFRRRGEQPPAIGGFEPGVEVLVLAAVTLRLLLPAIARFVKDLAHGGVVIDARDPNELRIVEVESLDRDRIVTVFDDHAEELRRDDDLQEILGAIFDKLDDDR